MSKRRDYCICCFVASDCILFTLISGGNEGYQNLSNSYYYQIFSPFQNFKKQQDLLLVLFVFFFAVAADAINNSISREFSKLKVKYPSTNPTNIFNIGIFRLSGNFENHPLLDDSNVHVTLISKSCNVNFYMAPYIKREPPYKGSYQLL